LLITVRAADGDINYPGGNGHRARAAARSGGV